MEIFDSESDDAQEFMMSRPSPASTPASKASSPMFNSQGLDTPDQNGGQTPGRSNNLNGKRRSKPAGNHSKVIRKLDFQEDDSDTNN